MADRFSLDKEREVAPIPDALTSFCIDNHAHLELITESEPDSDLIKAVLDEAKSVGINRVIQVGYNAEQSAWGVRCADAFPGRVLAAVALHPNEAPVVADLEGDLAKIAELAQHPRVRAIGETGLDFFRTGDDGREKQIYSFKRHIQIAKDVKKALMIHDRDAHREVLERVRWLAQQDGARSRNSSNHRIQRVHDSRQSESCQHEFLQPQCWSVNLHHYLQR